MVTIHIPQTSAVGRIHPADEVGQPTRVTVLYDNIVDESMLSMLLADSDYPIGNLVEEDRNTTNRTSGLISYDTWEIDLGSGNTEEYDTIAIAGSNLSSDALIKVGRGNSDPPTLATIGVSGEYFIHYWDAPSTERYVHFFASEDTSDGYIEMGLMFVGKRVQLDTNPQIPIKIIDKKSTTMLQTGGGQIWSYEDYNSRGYEMKFIVDHFPESYWDVVQLFQSRGYEKPFFFHLAPQDPNDSVFLAHTEKFSFSIDGKDARPGTWVVEEEL